MEFKWESFLAQHRDHIISEWEKRLSTSVSQRYAMRPAPEIRNTTTRACDGFARMLTEDNFDGINDFINEITRIRLDAGFPLADVQKAFELYRRIIMPILITACPRDQLCEKIQAMNRCLAYTIHRFSSHFQQMHETHLQEYAKRLEKDVAERTAELRASEDQYKSLVEGIRDGYLVLAGEKIVFVNSAFCRMHGVKEKGALFLKSFPDYVADENREKVCRIILQALETHVNPEAFEYLRQTEDSRLLPTEINFRLSPFRGRTYLLCIVRDITKRKAMDKKSREMERMAYIGKLTASLSHEIRNPLSSIKMNLQILGQNKRFTGNDKKRLDITQNEILRLEGILQELLDYAKPIAVQPTPVDINQTIRSCSDLLEAKFRKKKVICRVRPDTGLKEIWGDKSKLEQLVINLLLNALDSVEAKGEIIISTALENAGGTRTAVIRVADNGPGIPPDRLPHIFNAFYTTKASGTGLGLANVQRIVAAHKGRVKAFNQPGSGAAVEVCLPMGE